MAVVEILDASTAHITYSTVEWLTSQNPFRADSYPVAMSGFYGWLLVVPELECIETGWPEDLRQLLAYASDRGFPYVKLDQDAEKIAGLPVYGDEA